MCVIAVVKPENKLPTIEQFKNCWHSNPDGFGMMWVHCGEVKIYKTLKLSDAISAYESLAMFHESTPIVLHFRIGTQGENDLLNCHPFVVHSTGEKVDLAFCHNGIIRQLSGKEFDKTHPNMSDTRIFNKEILSKLPTNFHLNFTSIELIDDYVGTDKLVFLDKECNVVTVNERLGVVDKETGVWYSNSSYARTPWFKKAENVPAKKEEKASPLYQCDECGKQTEEVKIIYNNMIIACCKEHVVDVAERIRGANKDVPIWTRLKSKTSTSLVVFITGSSDTEYTLIGLNNGRSINSRIKKSHLSNLFWVTKENVQDYYDQACASNDTVCENNVMAIEKQFGDINELECIPF